MTNLLTSAEAAALLGVTPSAISRAVSRGRLKPTRTLPAGFLFSAARVEAYKGKRWQRKATKKHV